MRKLDAQGLQEKLDAAIRDRDQHTALELYDELASREPDEPRWPHRKGDLLLGLGRADEAVRAYERTVDLYAQAGFVARAAAMAKVILGLRPDRVEILSRVDSDAARRLRDGHRRSSDARPPTTDAEHSHRGPKLPELRSTRPCLLEEALRLTPADDADDDEVRFSDIDHGGMNLEIEITDIELAGAPDPAVDQAAFEDPVARSAGELACLPAIPLFADLPRQAFERMLRESDLVEHDKGTQLLRAGEPSDALYVIVEGQAEVHVPGLPPGAIVLREGDVVGETCLLEDAKRRADVFVQSKLRALRLPRALLDTLIREFPPVEDVLLEVLTRRLIANLVHTAEIFIAFDQHTRLELARTFEVRRADAGTVLIEPFKRSDGLYVVLLGKLEVRVTADEIVSLGPGATVGERSLLSRQPGEASVRTVTDCLLLRLPAARFAELAALYPPVLAHLAELAEQRAR